jgi:hypothetical protein
MYDLLPFMVFFRDSHQRSTLPIHYDNLLSELERSLCIYLHQRFERIQLLPLAKPAMALLPNTFKPPNDINYPFCGEGLLLHVVEWFSSVRLRATLKTQVLVIYFDGFVAERCSFIE